jgi:hypothetical protein
VAVITILTTVGGGVGSALAAKGGSTSCAPDTAWTSALDLTATLAPPTGASTGFGHRLRAVAATRNSSKAVVLGVPTKNQQLWVYVLDPDSLANVQAPQMVTLPTPTGGNTFFPQYGSVVSDFDGNGVPDFAFANTNPGTVYVVLGDRDALGSFVYTDTQRLMLSGAGVQDADASTFGVGVAASRAVDGVAHPLFVSQAAVAGKGTKPGIPGKIFVFAVIGPPQAPAIQVKDVVTPQSTPTFTDTLGAFGFAAGDVNLDGHDDIIAGAPKRDVGSVTDAGAVFVFLAAGLGTFDDTPSHVVTATTPVSGANFGDRTLFAGDLNPVGMRDIVATVSRKADAVYTPLGTGIPNGTSLFAPIAGQDSNFAYHALDSADVNGDGRADVTISSGWSSITGCSTSRAWMWLSTGPGTWSRLSVQPPDGVANGRFGSGSALVPDPNDSVANRGLLVVGDDGVTVNGVTSAGQVYIYRVK